MRFQEASFDRPENFDVDCVRGAKSAGFCIEALNFHPVWLPRELIVHFRRGFEMSDVRFQNIAPKFRVIACGFLAHEAMRFRYWNAQLDYKIFCG